MSSISNYALLGDCHGSALVSRGGSVDWWCPARFDSPSVFGRLLDPSAGHWTIRPGSRFTVRRRYLPDTLVLESEFSTETGEVRLTDALAMGPGKLGHDLGKDSPHVLIRRVEGVSGAVPVELALCARPGYGLVRPQVRPVPAGIEIVGGSDRLLLTGAADWRVRADMVRASLKVHSGDAAVFALRHSTGDSPGWTTPSDDEFTLADTAEAWRSWIRLHSGYEGPYLEAVRHSALILQALTYQPTGAMVAAPTTSLPEEVGGGANWDYRYAWLRDGSWTLNALWVAACPDEAARFFDWIAASAGIIADRPLPVIFAVDGQWDLTEHTLNHLRGYRDSRPVRVGNNAWAQRQLDVLGEVMECAWILREQVDFEPGTADFLISVADQAANTWQEPDAGMWEGREGERHYVASKLMCWVALDRAVKLAPALGPGDKSTLWAKARNEIADAILQRGWDPDAGAFVGAFGSDHLDAAVLTLPLVGFLHPTEPRVLATLEAIERRLTHGHLVQRWSHGSDEGAFVICSYWRAAALAMAGDVERAREAFDTVTSYANDVGLLSEEVDRRDGSLVGNFPQALSHAGLINAAWAIAQAERRGGPPPGARTDQQRVRTGHIPGR